MILAPEKCIMGTVSFVFGSGVLFVAMVLAALPALGQSKGGAPYRIDFDAGRDVTLADEDAKTVKKGLYITVRFTITLEGDSSDALGNDYRIVIEEDGHRVKEEEVPRPTPSEELSLVLAIDTSGSMKEHGRMGQARSAAEIFL